MRPRSARLPSDLTMLLRRSTMNSLKTPMAATVLVALAALLTATPARSGTDAPEERKVTVRSDHVTQEKYDELTEDSDGGDRAGRAGRAAHGNPGAIGHRCARGAQGYRQI